jgi:hypothetical protein
MADTSNALHALVEVISFVVENPIANAGITQNAGNESANACEWTAKA